MYYGYISPVILFISKLSIYLSGNLIRMNLTNHPISSLLDITRDIILRHLPVSNLLLTGTLDTITFTNHPHSAPAWVVHPGLVRTDRHGGLLWHLSTKITAPFRCVFLASCTSRQICSHAVRAFRSMHSLNALSEKSSAMWHGVLPWPISGYGTPPCLSLRRISSRRTAPRSPRALDPLFPGNFFSLSSERLYSSCWRITVFIALCPLRPRALR